MEIEILYEDNHLFIINKPFGYLVHGDATGDKSIEDFVKEYIKEKYDKKGNVFATAVHRLDRPVSGVLVLAKTSKGKERMSALFANQQIKKMYWALSDKFPSTIEGRLEQYLEKDGARNFVKTYSKSGKNKKKAVTTYKLVGKGEPYYLFELYPETGRSHQLRIAMRTIGSPILGDVKYGGAKAKNPRAICLHCRSLEFIHPIKNEKILVEAPLPNLQPYHTVWHMMPKSAVKKKDKESHYRK